MAVAASRVTCLTTPTLLVQADSDGCRVLIHKEQNHSIYIGGPTVSTSTGFLFDHDGTIDIDLRPHDEVYGCSTSGTEVAFILTVGNR